MKMTDIMLLTNNGLIYEMLGDIVGVRMLDGGYREVLTAVRDMVYLGHRLHNHPLYGSIKPNATPYRTIAISVKPHEFSPDHAQIISNSIAAYDGCLHGRREFSERELKDLRVVDAGLVCRQEWKHTMGIKEGGCFEAAAWVY